MLGPKAARQRATRNPALSIYTAALIELKISLLVVWLDSLSDASGELHVWLHDRDALGVLGTQLGVDEQVDQIVLGGFLESLDGETLESDVGLVVVLDQLTDQLRERELADQEVSGLLVLLDFAGGHCSLLGTSDLLDALAGAGGLADCLAGDGLAWCLGCRGALACGVFGACH